MEMYLCHGFVNSTVIHTCRNDSVVLYLPSITHSFKNYIKQETVGVFSHALYQQVVYSYPPREAILVL